MTGRRAARVNRFWTAWACTVLLGLLAGLLALTAGVPGLLAAPAAVGVHGAALFGWLWAHARYLPEHRADRSDRG